MHCTLRSKEYANPSQRQVTRPVTGPDIYSKTYNPPVEQGVVYAVIDKKRPIKHLFSLSMGLREKRGYHKRRRSEWGCPPVTTF